MNTLMIGARKRLLLYMASVAGLASFCGAALAQDQLQEVVVTAQKREQNIQNVPIAITAFTADTIRDKGVTSIGKLTQITPNVNLDAGSPFSGDTSVLSASIRGIGQDDFAFNLDPGVGVYLDGVFLARTIGANQNLLDVDRIEIAKGPQGTLFGRNTIGGAISIVTHTPGTEPRFIGQATLGRFNRRDFAFTADLPITQKVLTSLTVSSLVRDGYQKSIPFPATVPFIVDPPNAYPKAGFDTSATNGGQNQQVVRGKLLWNANDQFTLSFAADWQHQNQSSTPATVLSVQNTPANIFAFLYNTCISNPPAVLNSPDPAINPAAAISPVVTNTTTGVCGPRAAGTGLSPGGAPLAGAGYVNGPGGNLLLSGAPRIFWNFANTQTGNIDTTYSNGVSFAKNDAFGGALTLDWRFTDTLALRSISGYRQINWQVGIDLDGLPEQIQEVTDHQHQYQVSQELQLTGRALQDTLNYVVGLYYFKEAGYVHDFVPFEGILYVYDIANDIDTSSYAGYFHADYNVADLFTLILGGRYSRDDKKFVGGQADLNGFTYKISGCNPPSDLAGQHIPGLPPDVASLTCQEFLGFPVPGEPLRYFPAGENEQVFNVFTPTAGLQHQFSDSVMAYATWSKGFKSGGWTTRLSAPIASGTEAQFGPEFAKTTELGLKSQLFNRRVQVNTALFYTEYDGIQLNFQQGASPVLYNAGDARIKGAEVEAQALLGRGFALNFNGGYLDAYYTTIAPEVGIPLSSKLPKTPKYKLYVGPTYDFMLPNGGGMRFSVDFTYTAEMFNDALNTPELRRPATRALNAAVHYRAPKNNYEFVFGGTNLTNDRWLSTGSINLPAGEKVGTYNPPAEWYVSARLNLSP